MQVSEEWIRVAILWHELWHEGLEEASRLYFGERNVKGMFATLEPLHQMMERGPQTLKETSFNQVFTYRMFPGGNSYAGMVLMSGNKSILKGFFCKQWHVTCIIGKRIYCSG